VHSDTQGFGAALRAALREDPDIVLIGEMRDLETVESALRIAETGHLTFGTLHTELGIPDDQPHHRHLPVEPAGAGAHAALARPRRDRVSGAAAEDLGGRVAALEIMVPTPGIRNLIREDKVHQIYSRCRPARKRWGCRR
jgi:twitching motility protein PilT